MTLNYPDYDLAVDDVPAMLRTSPEVVEDLAMRGEIRLVVDDGRGYVCSRHLRSAGLTDLLTVEEFAVSKAVTVEQVESLIRLGVLTSSTPFAPIDNRPRIARASRVNVTDEAVATTTDEIKAWRAQQKIEQAEAERRAREADARTALDELADALGIDRELLIGAVREVARVDQAASNRKGKL